jgi:CheY-like chemotaxis protein
MPEKKNILIVDDDATTLKMLEGILSAAGYDVITASSGHEAVTLARELKPGLLVLDIALPGMDGINVAFKLREEAETKDIPIIFLSSLMEKDIVQEAATSSRNSFLRKPFDKEVFLREVKKYL